MIVCAASVKCDWPDAGSSARPFSQRSCLSSRLRFQINLTRAVGSEVGMSDWTDPAVAPWSMRDSQCQLKYRSLPDLTSQPYKLEDGTKINRHTEMKAIIILKSTLLLCLPVDLYSSHKLKWVYSGLSRCRLWNCLSFSSSPPSVQTPLVSDSPHGLRPRSIWREKERQFHSSVQSRFSRGVSVQWTDVLDCSGRLNLTFSLPQPIQAVARSLEEILYLCQSFCALIMQATDGLSERQQAQAENISKVSEQPFSRSPSLSPSPVTFRQ